MCFSATASFTSAAILMPAGLYCLKRADKVDKSYWAFAMLPFLFGLQQLVEGGVWLSINAGKEEVTHVLALGFLFFSHFLWLSWIPYTAYLTESSPRLRQSFLLIAMFGLLFGAVMFVPMLFNTELLTVSVVRHSIDYKLRIISDGYVSQQFITGVYMMVIFVPLLLSSDRFHRVFGVLVTLSSVVTWIFFDWVYLSVWCFFASLVTLYIFFMILRIEPAVRAYGSAS